MRQWLLLNIFSSLPTILVSTVLYISPRTPHTFPKKSDCHSVPNEPTPFSQNSTRMKTAKGLFECVKSDNTIRKKIMSTFDNGNHRLQIEGCVCYIRNQIWVRVPGDLCVPSCPRASIFPSCSERLNFSFAFRVPVQHFFQVPLCSCVHVLRS